MIENARVLAKHLMDLDKEKRMKIVHCLDTDYQLLVLQEMKIIENGWSSTQKNNTPPGKVPNCS